MAKADAGDAASVAAAVKGADAVVIAVGPKSGPALQALQPAAPASQRESHDLTARAARAARYRAAGACLAKFAK